MKLVLILMVKNESRIIRRCLEAAEKVVDAFCVCDTGSTDNTKEIAKDFLQGKKGCITEAEWKNFGHNRTISFQAAQAFVRDKLEWNLADTYGLLLDGDMVFVPGMLREQTLTEPGYTIIQCAGNLEYPNCRLIRMDREWICRGVTHEYWDGPTKPLPKHVCYIDDRNDGGCKFDKFERDARLLEQGLAEDPKNERYMFYLAQTYHSLARWKDSIAMYKKRIVAGGWFEEIWYSHYMIAQCYLNLGDPIRFESWMLRAYNVHPKRAESIYKLARYFREKSQHHKAYHYVQLGRTIPNPHDSLFMENDVYDGLFDYEATILHYYLNTPLAVGLRESMTYLLQRKEHLDNVYGNIGFYIEAHGTNVRNHPVMRNACGHDFHPTSTCIFDYKGTTYHAIRFVNYDINQKTGSYLMKDGEYSAGHPVRTRNVLWTPTQTSILDEQSVALPRAANAFIQGLEDVRVYVNAKNETWFTATVGSEYSEKPRIMHGRYHVDTVKYSDCVVVQSPINADCEKNWIPVNHTNDVLYRWYPLEVGTIESDTLRIHTSYMTPWFFRHLRGSAPPVLIGGELWCLVHFVHYSTPRKYFHCFVRLSSTYVPLAISLPFVFRSQGIEYCLGVRRIDNALECVVSTWDDAPTIVDIPMKSLEWIQV